MREIKIIGLLIVAMVTLSGCETVQTKADAMKDKVSEVIDQVNPANRNEVKTVKNDFDGSVHKFVKPGHVYRSQKQELGNLGQNAHFALGASWSSADPNNVILVALQLKLTRPFERIEFNVGGEIIKVSHIGYGMKKIDEAQLKYYNENYSQRSLAFYTITKSQFNKIVNDGKSKIRIYYGDGYFNGDLSIEKRFAAIIGFRNLQAAINQK